MQVSIVSVSWILFSLYLLTFLLSLVFSSWAVSPFVNAEKILRVSLADKESHLEEDDWLSESPIFHKLIWGLAQRLKDPKHPFDKVEEARYHFSFRYFVKFVAAYFTVSLMTGYVSGIVLNTMYVKVVSLAVSLIKMKGKGHYFLAQEELLSAGSYLIAFLSFSIFLVAGYYLTRYMSNMLFVFTRAIREHHFPLLLRDSDVYHGLADAISKVAREAGLERKK